ncbi:antibiotic biosynthesis monooxygenase family protein [Minwuia sp.]|uniref:antibiotic biosynthesis monooxygenase family protein n=1 Tax=Minwuia sp. TaxID=2493630 RepID=UPI003A9335DE
MYIAMNRFQIVPGEEAAFEKVWQERDSQLERVPGFVDFKLLKGAPTDSHTLYASHTIWQNHDAFEAWTRSEAFRRAHEGAGDRRQLYLGHPVFEGFDVVQQS